MFWSNEPVQNEDDTRHCRDFLHHHCFAFIAAATNISLVLVSEEELVKTSAATASTGQEGAQLQTWQHMRVIQLT